MIALVLAQGLPVAIGVLAGFMLGKAWGKIVACEAIAGAREELEREMEILRSQSMTREANYRALLAEVLALEQSIETARHRGRA